MTVGEVNRMAIWAKDATKLHIKETGDREYDDFLTMWIAKYIPVAYRPAVYEEAKIRIERILAKK